MKLILAVVCLVQALGNGVSGDYGALLGVTDSKSLVSRDVGFGGQWDSIGGSCCVTRVEFMNDDSLIGVGTDKQLYTKSSPDTGSWEGPIPNSCCVQDISVMPDGTIVGVSMDKKLVTRDTINGQWTTVKGSKGVVRVESDCDGKLYGVTASGSVKSRNGLNGDWKQMPSRDFSAEDIAIQPDGTMLGIQEGGCGVHVYDAASGRWGPELTASSCVTSIASFDNLENIIPPATTLPPPTPEPTTLKPTTPEPTTPEPAIPCSPPSTPTNGAVTVDSYPDGSSVSYSCVDGYELEGASSSTCEDGTWSGGVPTCARNQFADCNEIYNSGQTSSGVYSITPPGSTTEISVYCNMASGGGGTVIQRRIDGSVNFERTWAEYKAGFGDPTGEYWMGNDKIHELTTTGTYNLVIDMENWAGTKYSAEYSGFSIGNEASQYVLNIGNKVGGNAVDSLSYHKGRPFCTKDRDNDNNPSYHCAQLAKGAWWFRYGQNGGMTYLCFTASLNGPRSTSCPSAIGITWYLSGWQHICMSKSTMWLKKV